MKNFSGEKYKPRHCPGFCFLGTEKDADTTLQQV